MLKVLNDLKEMKMLLQYLNEKLINLETIWLGEGMGGEHMRITEVKSSINSIRGKEHHQQTLIWDGSVG